MAKPRISRTIVEERDTFDLVKTLLRTKIGDFERAIQVNRAKRETWERNGGHGHNEGTADMPSPVSTEEAWAENAGRLRRFIGALQ